MYLNSPATSLERNEVKLLADKMDSAVAVCGLLVYLELVKPQLVLIQRSFYVLKEFHHTV